MKGVGGGGGGKARFGGNVGMRQGFHARIGAISLVIIHQIFSLARLV